jgi:hypothetical protein
MLWRIVAHRALCRHDILNFAGIFVGIREAEDFVFQQPCGLPGSL